MDYFIISIGTKGLLTSFLADGVIDDEERKVLKAYFHDFVNIKIKPVEEKIHKEVEKVNISGIYTADTQVEFKNKNFCFTGILQSKAGNEIVSDIEKLGGKPHKNPIQNTHYLVVGHNGNPTWAYACYGRKVEKAISLRKKGKNIVIIHEYDFMDEVRENGIE